MHSLKNEITEPHVIESGSFLDQRLVKVTELPSWRGVGAVTALLFVLF